MRRLGWKDDLAAALLAAAVMAALVATSADLGYAPRTLPVAELTRRLGGHPPRVERGM